MNTKYQVLPLALYCIALWADPTMVQTGAVDMRNAPSIPVLFNINKVAPASVTPGGNTQATAGPRPDNGRSAAGFRQYPDVSKVSPLPGGQATLPNTSGDISTSSSGILSCFNKKNRQNDGTIAVSGAGTPLMTTQVPVTCTDNSQFTCTEIGGKPKCADGQNAKIPKGACQKQTTVKCNQLSPGGSTTAISLDTNVDVTATLTTPSDVSPATTTPDVISNATTPSDVADNAPTPSDVPANATTPSNVTTS
ncbi:hypothetical protein CROQUDRAFT_510936 [Cronartium quercuum f. sp. fusiforme G11]|uniref:Uncharacterized protein n=1 Tax=Cronartium quercuum f. sp. fusiforme G11 TaxID=708437 RepID=A0A9P6NNF0_9BASI|nr:hypothetical protein CROQUDRAFT_510936 [Cronartium quercuum f. sp. fusiforme G11]